MSDNSCVSIDLFKIPAQLQPALAKTGLGHMRANMAVQRPSGQGAILNTEQKHRLLKDVQQETVQTTRNALMQQVNIEFSCSVQFSIQSHVNDKQGLFGQF